MIKGDGYQGHDIYEDSEETAAIAPSKPNSSQQQPQKQQQQQPAQKGQGKFPSVADFSSDEDDEGNEDEQVAKQDQRGRNAPALTSKSLPAAAAPAPLSKQQQQQQQQGGVLAKEKAAKAKAKAEESEEEDDEDDFEILDVSPVSAPSVAMTWQDQLNQLHEAYKAMEVEHHAQNLAGNAQYYLAETATAVKSAYTFVRNPLSNNYTPLEQTQMRAIHSVYKSSFEEEIPFELKIDAEFLRPATKVGVEDLTKNSWVRTLGDGHLAYLAEDLIAGICGYQSERYHRKYWQGYLDDPTNLFLDEFKRWLVSFLSKTALDQTAFKKVQKRVHYLTDILAADIFQPGTSSQTTMKMVLVNTKKSLEEIVLPSIQREMLNSSAREHLGLSFLFSFLIFPRRELSVLIHFHP